MIKTLTQEQLKAYIEQYGDEDVYFSHYRETDGKIVIKFLPQFTKFVDEENLHSFKKELIAKPHLKDKYLKEIILTPNFAYIPNDDHSEKNKLVKNYKKFLSDVKNNRLYIPVILQPYKPNYNKKHYGREY